MILDFCSSKDDPLLLTRADAVRVVQGLLLVSFPKKTENGKINWYH